MPHRLTARGWLALLVTVFLWGSGFVAIRVGLRGYSPAHLALLRFLAASVTIILYALIAGVRLPARKDIPIILLAGFLGISLYQVALNTGEQTVTGGAAAMLVASAPIFSALLARIFMHERLRLWGWIGIAISFVGVSLIAVGEGGGIHFSLGAFFVLISAVATSVSILFQKRYLRSYNVNQFSTHLICAGTLFLLPFLSGLGDQIHTAPLSATLAAIYLGIFPAAISYLTWGIVLKKIPASVAASSLYTPPAFAIVIGWALLNEVPSALSLIGGALALAGVTLVNTKGHAPGALEIAPVEYAVDRGD